MRVAVICLASALALAACSKKPASQASSAPAGEGGNSDERLARRGDGGGVHL